MAVTTDIARTYRGPRTVIRDLLAQGVREDRAIAYLFAACLLIFIAQWPRLTRAAQGFDLPAGAEQPSLTQLLTYELFSWLMIWPLVLYIIAGLTHLAAYAMGGQGTAYGARLALFWALLASVPLALFYGLLTGLNGPTAATQIVGALWLGTFVWFWMQGQREASRPHDGNL